MKELDNLINQFNSDNLNSLLRAKSRSFRKLDESLSHLNDEQFNDCTLFGEFKVNDEDKMVVFSAKVNKSLSERSGKKAQYTLGKKFLRDAQKYIGGFFIFYDYKGDFRFSLIYDIPLATGRRDWSNFRRYTYFVSKDQTNKTFIKQIEEADFSSLEKIIEAFSVEKVTKQFYQEIANWYFWAMDKVEFPDDEEKDREKRNAKNLIRLITRIIFIWFMKEKNLVPSALFDKSFIDKIINYKDKTGSTYYKAILQNLFFATLNTQMKKDDKESRIFVEEAERKGYLNDAYLQQGYYRYSRFIKDKKLFLEQFENVPFLNGGLFECLDKKIDGKEIRIDCFSDNPKNETRLKVPDELFFLEEETETDLSNYLEKGKNKKVTGLLTILKRYNFTIDENTPIDQDVALDPELLGKVFENLLASYNPETATTARKATGSYYTPREIVEYMVNESLVAHLKTVLNNDNQEVEQKLRMLFDYAFDENPFDEQTTLKLIDAIEKIKILDPACGSGAFPMGVLHKLVLALHKLDPENKIWKQRLLNRVPAEIRSETEQSLQNKSIDYIRKLGLIENCIYGVDIQEIAIQISKLRFFISLLVEQQIDDTKPNRDIRALPNLETKFVAANTLIGLIRPVQMSLVAGDIEELEKKLFEVREEIFYTNSRKEKLELQRKEKQLREKLKIALKQNGFQNDVAEKITSWDPFDQNTHAEWFDPEWMFGVKVNESSGFDIVIGNPPYLNVEKIDKTIKSNISKFRTAYQKYDLYVLFYEKGINLLKHNGQLIYITSNKFLSQGYGLLLRQEFLKHYIHQIINFNYDIFEAATVRTCIFHLQKTNIGNKNIKIIDIASQKDSEKFKKLIFNYLDQNIFKNTEENNFRINLTNQKIEILNRITCNSIKIEDICSVNYGLRPVPLNKNLYKDVFIKSTYQKGYKYYYEGKNMGNWLVREFSFIDYKPDIMYNPMFPELFENPKLSGLCTLSDINKLRFIYDDTGAYTNHSVAILTLWYFFEKVQNQTIQRNISVEKINRSKEFNYLFIQGILNSKLIKFFVNELLYDGTHFYPNHMKSLPIKAVPLVQQQPLIDLVEKIHNILKENINADVTNIEKEIDHLVYQLYELTPEEIEIIEGGK